MEHIVNLMHAVYKIQSKQCCLYEPGVWSNPSRGKLAGTSGPQMQDSGGKEHFCTSVTDIWDMPSVIVVLLPLLCIEHACFGTCNCGLHGLCISSKSRIFILCEGSVLPLASEALTGVLG